MNAWLDQYMRQAHKPPKSAPSIRLRTKPQARGKVFDAPVDLGNMQSGDEVEIRVYIMALTGGTLRRAYYHKYVGAQDDESRLKSPIVYVPAMTLSVEWKLTLKQTAGTGRDFPWKVFSD